MIHFPTVTEKKVNALYARMQSLEIDESQFEESFTRSSGPGGQNVNKNATCVVLKHIPTGLSVKMQKERTQAMNRFFARRRICELIEEKKMGQLSPQALKAEKIRKQKSRRKRRKS